MISKRQSARGQERKQLGGDSGVIRYRSSLANTCLDVMRARGWREARDDGDWDIYWVDVSSLKDVFDRSHMSEFSKICHFRNHYELTRKNLMDKNLRRHRKQLEKEGGREAGLVCDFTPCSFELPSEYQLFVEEYKRCPGQIWIMKPAGSAQGKGIFLFQKLKDVAEWKKPAPGEAAKQAAAPPQLDAAGNPKKGPDVYVVQKYLDSPYLVGGRKFDIRLYVLVTSYNPMKVWTFRDGFARFSGARYSLDSIEDTYVHLTNVALQKTAKDFNPDKGCKWSMKQLRQFLCAKHGNAVVLEMMHAINDIFIVSLQAMQKVMINDKHCFELYGYDILLDSVLKPWLIEVNASPSFTASSKEDYELKYSLLYDCFSVIDLERRLTGNERRVGGFDLMWDNGPVYANEGTSIECVAAKTSNKMLNCYLGCASARERNLRDVVRKARLVRQNESLP
ncbi:PREDICTED: probable tubulin polyglutamylase TTLL9 [Priapulus caudatus]|uniref:Tubulin--tyrosine ligase-like protein 9 n=1 Tax=Priapulus caudatus TaxID=37621 RepID=A0ABM1EHS4_PRICU|nr:PREDICTED: probable tubulin polyglutamylase TTLL9 [Priapulus caudatus]